MDANHLYFVITVLTVALVGSGIVMYRIRKRMWHPELSDRDSAPDTVMRKQASRAMVQILCDMAVDTITRKICETGDTQEPVHIATTMVDVAIKTGHLDVLDETLSRIESNWPSEVVIAIWTATTPVAAKLPSRDAMWQRCQAYVHES